VKLALSVQEIRKQNFHVHGLVFKTLSQKGRTGQKGVKRGKNENSTIWQSIWRKIHCKQMLQSGSVTYQVVHRVSIHTKNLFDGLRHTFCSLIR